MKIKLLLFTTLIACCAFQTCESDEPDLDIPASDCRTILYKTCIDSYYSAETGTMQVIRSFSGLSVYIPQTAYPQANNAYAKLKWAAPVHSGTSAIFTGV